MLFRAESFGGPADECPKAGKLGEDWGAGRRGEVVSAELLGLLTVVCGLKVTVLCGLGAVELEGVGGGKSGDVSVEAEAIAAADTRLFSYIEHNRQALSLDLGLGWKL